MIGRVGSRVRPLIADRAAPTSAFEAAWSVTESPEPFCCSVVMIDWSWVEIVAGFASSPPWYRARAKSRLVAGLNVTPAATIWPSIWIATLLAYESWLPKFGQDLATVAEAGVDTAVGIVSGHRELVLRGREVRRVAVGIAHGHDPAIRLNRDAIDRVERVGRSEGEPRGERVVTIPPCRTCYRATHRRYSEAGRSSGWRESSGLELPAATILPSAWRARLDRTK